MQIMHFNLAETIVLHSKVILNYLKSILSSSKIVDQIKIHLLLRPRNGLEMVHFVQYEPRLEDFELQLMTKANSWFTVISSSLRWNQEDRFGFDSK